MPRSSRTMVVLPGGTISPASPCAGTSALISVLSSGNFGSVVWPSQNRAIYIPFRLDWEITVLRMATLNGATLNGNVDVAIMDVFGNKIVNMGSTAQASASTLQTFDIADTKLLPDNYFLYLCSNSATATLQGWAGVTALGLQACGVQQEDRAGSAPTAPTAATFANPASAYVPYIALDFKGTF